MSLKVNLLKKAAKSSKKINILKSASIFNIVFSLLFISSFLFVYIYWFMLSNKSKSLDEQIENYNLEIAAYKEIELKKGILNNKLTKIQEIQNKRSDFAKGIEEVEKIMPEEIFKKNISLDYTGTTNMVVIASNSAQIETFVENLKKLKDKGLTKATLVNLKLENNAYDIELKIEIPKKEI